jgi:hypothetical protein
LDAPVAFGEALPAGTRLTLFSNDKPDRFSTVIKFWMDKTSCVALDVKTGVPSYQIEDGLPRRRREEGRTHLLILLPIEEDGDNNRWCSLAAGSRRLERKFKNKRRQQQLV